MAPFFRDFRARLHDMPIGRRLMLDYLIVLACMALIGVFSLSQIQRLAGLTVKMYRHPLTVSNAVRDVNIKIVRMHRSMRELTLSTDRQSLEAASRKVAAYEREVARTFDLIRERFLGDQRDVEALIETFQQWKPIRDEIMLLMLAGQVDKAAAMVQNDELKHVEGLQQELQNLTDFAGRKADQFFEDAASAASQAYWLTVGLLALAVGASLVIAMRMARRIARPLQQAVQIANQVSEGDLSVQVPPTSRDEFGQMLTAMQRMIAYIQDAALVAEHIANQQLAAPVTPKSPQDRLNHSLQRMVANLQGMLADINRSLNDTEEQNWLKEGLNQLNAAVLGDQPLREVCRIAVSFVARYVEAGHAVIYTYDEDENVLRLGGTFAMTEHDRLADNYHLGEGVIGQVARDRAPMLLENLRRGDQVISTGTVSEAPFCTYTMPLLYNDALYGVLEVATCEALEKGRQRFLDEAGRVLATLLFSALQRERVQTLLEESQRAAREAEIAVHDAQNAREEAQQQSAELQRANTQLEEQQQRLQQQSEELRQINVHLEEQQAEIQEQRTQVREQEAGVRQARNDLERRARELEAAGRQEAEAVREQVARFHDPLHAMLDALTYVVDDGDDAVHERVEAARQTGEQVLAMVHHITEGVPLDDPQPAGAVRGAAVAGEASAAETAAESADGEPDEAAAIDDDRRTLLPGEPSILVIEDNADIADSLVTIIRAMDFRVLLALNGLDGLALAARFRPTGILLDLMLPDMNGVEVLRELKRTRELRGIPVHIMSSKDRDETLLEAGAIGFAQKPVSEDDVRGVVHNLVQESQRMGHRVLVAEDDGAQREAILQLLSEQPAVETVGVASKEAAIREIDSGRYDVAILDLSLQDSSGYEVCRYVKEHAIDLPIIIYTGKDLDEAEERELRQFTDSIIMKTAHSYERLLDEVGEFLQRVKPAGGAASAPASPAHAAADIDLHGRKILIVDDDVKNVFVLASVLEDHGAIILDARNGQEALTMLRNQADDIHLVLMDVMMPLMDGYETMRAIRKDAQLQDIPIIAITAKTLLEDRLQCIESGADDYLTKPVDYDSLLRLVNAWIEKD